MIAIVAENPYTLIAWFALFVSVLTFLYSIFTDKRSKNLKLQSDYVVQLENRIEILERHLKDAEVRIQNLEHKNSDLMTENIELLRKLATLK